MTRPEIIRADSIDLQAREAPSAKEHLRLQVPISGSKLPHQAETLREVAAETAEANLRSPRISWANGDAADLQQYADDLSAGVVDSLTQQQPDARANMAAQPREPLAVAQNVDVAGQETDDGDLDGDGEDGMDDDDMMDKMSSSPSIDDENIDFDLVYALHTFVATVEGQANATKGDEMVLLDDSNSYWWLVRVVKDSSIGYLPAEHIETPTERLARLNKHRNIDLSATMLGDQADKPKAGLKSAMKRTKRKTVQFSGNTYHDYSDQDFSSEDEEDLEAEYLAQQQQQQQQQAQQTQQQSQQATGDSDLEDETAMVEPLKPKSQPQEARVEGTESKEDGSGAPKGLSRTSDEIFEVRSGEGPKKTSDGTVRDSFFNETVETKKITLTPNLLRDDGSARLSSESKDIKQRPSLDKLEKDNVFAKDDKKKKDKKEKDKKPSAIRNFFSRKDKKAKGDDDDDSLGKRSIDSSQDRDGPDEEDSQLSSDKAGGVQRSSSKLQKQQPRTEPPPTRKPGAPATKDSGMDLVSFLSEGKVNNVASQPPATMRVVIDPDLDEFDDERVMGRGHSPERPVEAVRKPEKSNVARKLSARAQGSEQDLRPQKVIKAKSRVELDDFDSTEDDVTPPESQRAAPVIEEQSQQLRPKLPGAYPDSYLSTQTTSSVQTERAAPTSAPPQPPIERLSESPIEVSPAQSHAPPPLMVDTSSQEEDHSARSSPELIEHEDTDGRGHKDSVTTTSTSGVAASTWNDTNLRAFFDSGTDIRDLLVVVYDKTDVEPAGPEHPVAGTLFKEQNAKLAEITTQLDHMLGDWLARKQRLRSGV